MTPDTSRHPAENTGLAARLNPRTGVRAQLLGAAAMWTVGATILLVRGAFYLRDEHWALWLIAVAVILGVVKSQMLLDRVARKAVARIRERGRACFFGFFSPKTWVFVALMMGGGMMLRRTGLNHGILAVIYVGVGTALVLADRIFWHAVFDRRATVSVAEPAEETTGA